MRKLIAIIPARGGSKRLKHKNIYPLLGKPLIEYSIEACAKCDSIANVYVSTDDPEIAAVSEKAGAKVLMRPSNLADDTTPKIIAIRQAIQEVEKIEKFDDVAIVQANSPEISAAHLQKAYDFMCDHNLWEVMSADDNGVQNAAIRLVKKEVAFQSFLSAHCGFVTMNLLDVHTKDDIVELEKRMA